MHLVPGRVLPTLQIGTKFNRSSTRVTEMDTVHPIYLILTICAPQVVHMFNKVLKIPIHVLHPLLPPPVSHTQRYGLRPRVHDRTLPEKSSNLVDCNFIIRMLYLNAYWLNNGLFMLLICYVLLYVVALCVKMRYVILCIKRLLIDWLIDFMLDFNRNHASILYRFRHIAGHLSEVADFDPPHLHLAPQYRWWPRSNFAEIFGIRKLESLGYRVVLFLWSYV